MINSPSYCTREDVKRALDRKEGVTADWEIDRVVEAGSRAVESPNVLNRVFYPTVDTRVFDWPTSGTNGWTLWLDENEIISVTEITNGDGTILAADEYFLEPRNVGPPYASIDINIGSGISWEASASTFQQSLSVEGVFGYNVNTRAAGNLEAAIGSTSATSITITDGSKIGVGDLLLIDTERLLVMDRSIVTTGTTLGGNIAAQKNVEQFDVVDGSLIHAGEEITIGAETMLVLRVNSNTVTVKRAWSDTTLASHATSDVVYASRSLTVSRGDLGTTAATHLDNAAVYVHDYPSSVRTLAIAESLAILGQERSGYAQVIGSGDSAREMRGNGLRKLREDVRANYGRKGRCW